MNRLRCFTALISGAIVVSIAHAQESAGVPRILLDRNLRSEEVMLLSVGTDTIQFRDATGLLRREPAADYLAVVIDGPVAGAQRLPDADAAALDVPGLRPWDASVRSAPTATITLADACRATGWPQLLEKNPDVVAWIHPHLGPLRFPIDDVRTITFGEADLERPLPPRPDVNSTDDVLVLQNGDTLRGFLESLDDPVEFSSSGRTTSVPLERVARITLAGPTRAPAGARIWLADSSVLSVESISRVDAGARLKLRSAAPGSDGEQGITVPLASLAAVVFDVSALRPLAALQPAASPPGEPSLTPKITDVAAAPLGIADVELTEPGSVAWLIPPDLARFAAQARLPAGSWEWGDCTLVIELSPAATEPKAAPIELFRHAFDWRHPIADVQIDLPSREKEAVFTLRLLPGTAGSAQDRLELTRPMFAGRSEP